MSPTPGGPAIEARGLTKRFGHRTAVDEVSFRVLYGSVTGFVGGNGSGKTTTMRMLLGLTVPSAGSALLAGRPMAEVREPRRLVGATLDRAGAHPGHTGRRHLALLATAAGLPRHRTDDLLDRTGLADVADQRIGTYSTGMRQRLGLAGALLGEPSILVLDEPSSGLDPAGIRWLRTLLRSHADAGGAVLISTHQLAELARVVDDLVVMDRGRMVAAGPAATVLGRSGAASIEDLVLAVAP